jgi:hypothetical protein
MWIPSRHKFTTSRDVIVYEKLPEHEIEPIITSTSSEGVTQSESTTSEVRNPNIAEDEQPTADPPPVLTETQFSPTVSSPTPPAQIPTRDLPNQLVPPPIPVQPRRSEHTVRPTWRQAAIETQNARDLETKAMNKAVRDARAERRGLKAKAAANAQLEAYEQADLHETWKLHTSHIWLRTDQILHLVMCWAGPGSKARAWARLLWAWA